MNEVNRIFIQCRNDVDKHLDPALKKISFLYEKCTNKKLQDNIRNKINKEEWEHAVEAMDKQRSNMDFTYNELEAMMKNIDVECENSVKKSKKKLFELVEGEFSDLESLATKTRDKLIHLKSSKKQKVNDFIERLKADEIREFFNNKNTITETSEEFLKTKTFKYGE